ncbi:hypothetical protein ACWDZ4_19625 [Streptomyces sp. NPDC003016]
MRELPPEGFAVLDGALIATGRIAAGEPYAPQGRLRPASGRHEDLPQPGKSGAQVGPFVQGGTQRRDSS